MMTLKKAYLTVILSAIVCAAIGALLGWGIGTLAPDAYVGMLRLPPGSFSPVQFGVGVGLIQGLFTGIVLGVVLCALVAWHEIRLQNAPGAGPNEED